MNVGKGKKLLSCIVAVVVVFTMSISTNFALAETEEASNENVVRITAGDGSSTYYTTVETAVAALNSGDTLQLLKNIDTNIYKAYATKSIDEITIDLNGCKITGSKNSPGINIREVGKMTIEDSSTNKTAEIVTDGGYGITFWGSNLVIKDNVKINSGEKEQVNIVGTDGCLELKKSTEYTIANAPYFVQTEEHDYYYRDFAKAKEETIAVTGEETVKLGTDIKSMYDCFSWSGEGTIDLNGHTVTQTRDSYYIMTIDSSDDNITFINSKETGGFEAAGSGFFIQNGKLTLDGVKVNAKEYGITGNGTLNNNTNIIVKNGIEINVDSDSGAGIYHPHLGTITIDDSKITGPVGVQMCAGTLTVNSGTITGTKPDDRASKTGDGLIPDGAAISVVNRSYPGGTPSVYLKGGKFVSNEEDAVAGYTWSSNSASGWTEVK